MVKIYFLIFGLALGIGLSKISTNSSGKKDIQATKETDRQIPSQEVIRAEQVISNCEQEISKAQFGLLYKALDIDSKSLITGANGIPFDDPRMFVEMMNGFTRGSVCVDYVKDGTPGTNCIQRKIIPNFAESDQNKSENVGRNIAVGNTQDDSLLSELLSKKGLIPVRDPQTGDISGYTKMTK